MTSSSSFSVGAIVQGFLDGTAEVRNLRCPTMTKLAFLPSSSPFPSFPPSHQPYQWGILAGCVVYTVTVLVVLYLLVAGGSFKRMREQVSW
jgi:hypothetical protein